MTWSVPDRFIMSILRGRRGTVNIHPVVKGSLDEKLPSYEVSKMLRE